MTGKLISKIMKTNSYLIQSGGSNGLIEGISEMFKEGLTRKEHNQEKE